MESYFRAADASVPPLADVPLELVSMVLHGGLAPHGECGCPWSAAERRLTSGSQGRAPATCLTLAATPSCRAAALQTRSSSTTGRGEDGQLSPVYTESQQQAGALMQCPTFNPTCQGPERLVGEVRGPVAAACPCSVLPPPSCACCASSRSSSRCRASSAAASAASRLRRSLASWARRSFSAAVRSFCASAASACDAGEAWGAVAVARGRRLGTSFAHRKQGIPSCRPDTQHRAPA